MAVTEKISSLVQNQFPAFYKEEGPKFLAFMEAYYEYMEQNGKLTDGIRNLKSYSDIDKTTEEYLDYFLYTFVPSLPVDIIANKELLVKNIKQGNLARGTLQSYKLLFRVLYDEDIDFLYPADQILKVSDGDWVIDKYLVANFDDKTYGFIGKTIIGEDSRATALVEDVVSRNVKGRHLMQILLSNVEGIFKDREIIHLLSDTNVSGHKTFIDAGINKLTIITPGSDYQLGDIVDINSSGAGDFGKAVVTGTQDLGGILTFDIENGGSGYTTTDDPFGATKVSIEGNSTLPASFSILASDLSDTIDFSLWTTTISSNTLFGDLAPAVDNVIRAVDPISGTVTLTSGNNTVIGVDSRFSSDLEQGDKLYLYPSNEQIGVVDSISNNTVLTTTSTVDHANVQITYERTKTLSMNTFANTIIGAPSYGFREEGEEVTSGIDFRDNYDSRLYLSGDETTNISVGDSLFGDNSSANATVTGIYLDGSTTVVKADGYKNFTTSDTIFVNSPDFSSGEISSAVSSFSANTVGRHMIEFGVVPGAWEPNVGDEIVGVNTNCFGVIQQLISNTENSYTHDPDGTPQSRTLWKVMVSANNTSLTNGAFDNGLILGDTVYDTGSEKDGEGSKTIRFGAGTFNEEEGIRLVGHNSIPSSTVVANVASSTANNTYETAGTSIRECLIVEATTVGTISNISDIDGGAGYTQQPVVRVVNPDIAALGIGESILTLETDDLFWDTGTQKSGHLVAFEDLKITGENTNFENEYSVGSFIHFEYNSTTYTLQITQIGEGSPLTNKDTVMYVTDTLPTVSGLELDHSLKVRFPDSTDRLTQSSTGAIGDIKVVTVLNNGQAIDGKYQVEARVWQRFGQKSPGNISWELGDVTYESIFGEYFLGDETDDRTPVTTGTITIAAIQDLGILGNNAVIDAGVGADGTITSVRILDSGFSYLNNEEPLLEPSGRGLSTSARVKVSLSGVANAEGYYSSDRSHISTTRGYIQDSDYYQEFSYEIISKNSLSKYRDIALNLIHPAGQKLFGRYRSVAESNIPTTVLDPYTNYQGVEKLIKTDYTADLELSTDSGTADFTPDSFDVTFAGINPENTFVSKQKFNFTVPVSETSLNRTGVAFTTDDDSEVLSGLTSSPLNHQVYLNEEYLTIDEDYTLNGSGNEITITGVVSNNDIIELYREGSIFVVEKDPADGVNPHQFITLQINKVNTSDGSGSITITNSDATVTGTGFIDQINEGDRIYLDAGDTLVGVVDTIAEDSESLELTAAYSGSTDTIADGAWYIVGNTANLQSAWTYGEVSGANVFYNDGNTIVPSSGTFAEFGDGDTIVLKTSEDTHRFVINTISTNPAEATIKSTYVGPNIQSAEVYYIQGQD